MKKIVSAVILAAICASNPASAGSGTGSASDWNGQYVGIALGVSNERTDPTVKAIEAGYFITTDPGQVNPEASADLNETGFNGSLIWGMNRRSGNFVYGVEADLSRTDFNEQHSSGNIAYITLPAETFSITTKVSSYWAASLRPRLGYVRDKSLYFVSAGPALKRFKYDFNFSDTVGAGESTSLSSSKVALGVAASLGAERKFRDGWSLRFEYLFSYYDNIVDKRSALSANPADGFINEVDHQTHNFRIALIKAF